MKRLLAFAALLLAAALPAQAQQVNLYCQTGPAGLTAWQPASAANPCPVAATASISGFTAVTTGTPISVTTSNSTGTLPAGVEVVATNVGATNGAYCALGATATTSSQYIAPNGGWFAFAIGASTQLTCVTSTSTTTVNMTGGAGLPTGTGGGGGGSGGAITAADGAIVSIGTTTDTACATDNGTCTELALLKRNNQRLTTIITTGIPVTNANANGSATAANSSPVVLASNQTAADPCMFQAKTNLPISQNGTSSVQLIALSGSTSIYVCSLSLIAAGATTVAITTGTGSACVTGNAAVIGSTTSNIANSMSFAANGGMTMGNGQGTVAKGAASSELCMILGTSVFVSGNLTYVQQ